MSKAKVMEKELAPKAKAKSAAPAPVSADGASVDDRMQAGRALRETVPRVSHADFSPAPDRPNPIVLLQEQAADRVADLVPIRYGRMVSSPFAFLRGSAAVMAQDLASTPRTGIDVQACGDAHVANFGVFATPERHVVFDLNDFDETLPGPWEWDLKRLAASLIVASRYRGFTAQAGRATVTAMVRTYSLRLRELAAMGHLEVWYNRIDAEQLLAAVSGTARKTLQKGLAKAESKDHLQAQAKLTEVVDGRRRIVHTPPLLARVELPDQQDFIRDTFNDYMSTLPPERQHLLRRYHYADVALKVVGVGSVGTRCFIVLLHGRDDADPLFLQVKEASESVLAKHLAPSEYANQGQRVVEGQRLMQAASDMFLGWIEGRGDEHRHFYWRQLHDVKGSADLEVILPEGLILYSEVCGAALARAHARSGDAAMITGYIGTGSVFANAVGAFAEAYADQTERDHALLAEAIKDGSVEAQAGI